LLMLVHLLLSIENRSPPVDRIVPLRATLSCNMHAALRPNYQAVGLDDICPAHYSYRRDPVGRLEASSTFWSTGHGRIALNECLSIQSRCRLVEHIVPLQATFSCNLHAALRSIHQAVGLDDIFAARRSYRCVPVGRLGASSTFWSIGWGMCLSIQSRF